MSFFVQILRARIFWSHVCRNSTDILILLILNEAVECLSFRNRFEEKQQENLHFLIFHQYEASCTTYSFAGSTAGSFCG